MKASKVVSEAGRFDFEIKAVYQKTLSDCSINNDPSFSSRKEVIFPSTTDIKDLVGYGKVLSDADDTGDWHFESSTPVMLNEIRVVATYVSTVAKGSGNYDVKTMKRQTESFHEGVSIEDMVAFAGEISIPDVENDWVLFMIDDDFVSVKMKATYTFGVKTVDDDSIGKDQEIKYFPVNTPVDDINLFGKLLSKDRKEVDYVLTIVEYIYS